MAYLNSDELQGTSANALLFKNLDNRCRTIILGFLHLLLQMGRDLALDRNRGALIGHMENLRHMIGTNTASHTIFSNFNSHTFTSFLHKYCFGFSFQK